jgi:hypothetical protein
VSEGAAAGAAAAAASAQATKASGAIVRVEPETFVTLLQQTERPLVVVAHGGFPKRHRYLTPYRGLVFYTAGRDALTLSPDAEVVAARKIWVPG